MAETARVSAGFRVSWDRPKGRPGPTPRAIRRELQETVETSTRILHRYARHTINRSQRFGERTRSGPPTWTTIKMEIHRRGDVFTGEVFSDDPVAGYLERGTRPHIIRPRRAKVLRFTIGNRVVYATRVQHPGTRPYRWMEKAELMAEAQIRERYRRAGANLFGQQIGGVNA